MPTPEQLQVYEWPKTPGQIISNWGKVRGNFESFLATIEEIFAFTVQTLAADSNLALGDLVYSSGDGTVDLAVATSEAASDVIGIARAAVTSPASGEIQTGGVVTITGASLTPGALYFLSASTPGAMTTTAPSSVGEYVVPVGIALEPDKFLLRPEIGVLL